MKTPGTYIGSSLVEGDKILVGKSMVATIRFETVDGQTNKIAVYGVRIYDIDSNGFYNVVI